MGGKTDLDRVVAYVPTELKKELEQWAEAEERSVSWLVAKLIDRALQQRRERGTLPGEDGFVLAFTKTGPGKTAIEQTG
ncbi:ribbon-helix-helix domain-containing protein [Gloeobacter violaceus]|nr:ribbon-helix-helix protein, CopG family [Gloeobacter violaceus]